MRVGAPSLGEELRRYREGRGWTRKVLAHRVGCAVVTLQKVERDERRPSVELLQLLAQALELSAPATAALLARLQAAATEELGALPSSDNLIGRTEEGQRIAQVLTTGQTRLLTLTGPGGVGKTCLATAVVAALRTQFRDGAYSVELAAVQHPEFVLPTIARALGVADSGEKTIEQQLLAFLQTKHLLLYLDNVEHLCNAAPLCQQLLGACAHLVILTTSRAPLQLAAEMVLPIAPLAVPTPATLTRNPLTAAMASPAVALFVQRAQAVKADFGLTAENAAAIGHLCIHLDGLPLAIELVAARCRLLSPASLLNRVVTATGQPRLGLLVQEQATLPGSQPARHRTLRETLDWSYHLLTGAEQRALRRFALFAGGCTVAAAEALLHDEQEPAEQAAVYTWDLLTSLLDKSLLYQREVNGEARFFMLETISEYAREQLLHQEEAVTLQRRHAYYYAELAQSAFAQLVEGVHVEFWLAVTAQEHHNFRCALAWTLAHDEAVVALRMATALWRYWWIRGHWQEGRAWLEQALHCAAAPTADHQRLRARALRSLGGLCVAQGDHLAARTYLEESIVLARAVADEYVESLALSSLATLCCHEGDFSQAEQLLLQSMVYDHKTNNARDLAISYGMLGEIGLYQADYAKAEHYLRQALDRQQLCDDQHSLMLTQLNLGDALLGQNRYEAAQAYLTEGLHLARKLGNPLAEATGLQQLAELHFALEQPDLAFPLLLDALHCAEEHGLERSSGTLLRILGEQMIKQGELTLGVRLLGACKALENTHTIVLAAQERTRLDQLLTRLRTLENQHLIEAAYQTGQSTALPSALAEARQICGRQGQP